MRRVSPNYQLARLLLTMTPPLSICANPCLTFVVPILAEEDEEPFSPPSLLLPLVPAMISCCVKSI